MKIGIVGFGNFTRLMIKHLQDDFEIVVLSRSADRSDKAGLQFEFAPAKEVLTANIVIISIPAQFMREWLAEHVKYFTQENLVLDVASIKEAPVAAMLERLPEHCQILGTHPIFGPGSARAGLQNLRIALCPVRIDDGTLEKIEGYLEQKGLAVIRTTPKEHDEQMAFVLGLTQYLGRAMQRLSIPNLDMSTPAYDFLLTLRDIQGRDSWDMFESIMSTKAARRINRSMKETMQAIDDELHL